MKKLTLIAAALTLLATLAPAFAGDKGPDRVAKLAAPAFAVIEIEPAGAAERFEPEWLVFDCPAAQTQTVQWVVGAVTNTVDTFIPAAGAKLFAITNVPALLFGDKLLITPSGVTATTNNVYLYGRRWN